MTGRQFGEAWREWPLPETTTTLRAWQAHRCAWCGDTGPLDRDHCHETGLIRGLLCRGCNVAEAGGLDAVWGAWRKGDNPAAAIGHFEIFLNQMGYTPINIHSALGYYTNADREAWLLGLPGRLEAGELWPAEAPWTDDALARKQREWDEMLAAVQSFPGVA